MANLPAGPGALVGFSCTSFIMVGVIVMLIDVERQLAI